MLADHALFVDWNRYQEVEKSKNIPDRDRLCALPFDLSPGDDEQSIEMDGREEAPDL